MLPELGSAAGAGRRCAASCCCSAAVDATLADAMTLGLQALLVDDLHFADDASLELLQSLTQSDSLAPLRWGLAQRPAELAAGADAMRAARSRNRSASSRCCCNRWTWRSWPRWSNRSACPSWMPDRLAPALLKHTGGNPMFALETLKDLRAVGRGACRWRARPPAAAGDGRGAGRAPAGAAVARGAASWRAWPRWPGRTSAPSWPRPCSKRTRWTSPSPGANSKPRR